MSPQPKTLAPFLALFIFCFAAQGVSSASERLYQIGSWNNDDIYSEQSTVAEILALGTDLYSARAPAIFTCLGHYINDIKEVAIRGHAVSADALKLVLEVTANFAKCADDLKCKVEAVVTGASQIMRVFNEARALFSDIRMVVGNVAKCTREGGPTPAHPTTTTPPPTTPPPTTKPPTTAPPTTAPPTTALPTTAPTTTAPPTTKPPQPTQPSSTTKP